jgi:hypothetical protein
MLPSGSSVWVPGILANSGSSPELVSTMLFNMNWLPTGGGENIIVLLVVSGAVPNRNMNFFADSLDSDLSDYRKLTKLFERKLLPFA